MRRLIRGVARRRGCIGGLTALGLVVMTSCAQDLDTSRTIPPRGTVGELLYGVICDRISAEALHEDETGASYVNICHKDANGNFANTVDQSSLPVATEGAVDIDGNPVSVEQQMADRAHAVARVQSVARDRTAMIAAFDTIIPDEQVPVKDLANSDDTMTCNAGPNGTDALSTELVDMLSRFQDLYNDGTIPQSTEALSRLMDAFTAATDAQTSLARFDARQGYKPLDLDLGAVRPLVAYPKLRDLANATLTLLSADSNPYDPNATYDAKGNRIPEPGAAYAQFSSLLAAAHEELRTETADPVAAALTTSVDPTNGRTILSRPRGDLEVLQSIMYAEDPTFGTGDAHYIVKRDSRGYASVPLVNGAVPAPFVDKDNDGLPDINAADGTFVTTDGKAPPPPFFAPNGTSTTRDASGRAIANGAPLYGYLNTTDTFAASLLTNLKPLVNPDPTQNHETLMNALAGAYTLFGSRDIVNGSGTPSTKQYAPDPSLVAQWQITNPGTTPPADLGTAPVKLAYNAFETKDAPMLDLVYAAGNFLGDPTTDDTLQYVDVLFQKQRQPLARIVGAMLAWKDIANKHPEAHIPATSTFWDEILDVLVQIEKEPGLLEDILRALGDDNSLLLPKGLSAFMQFRDQITYDMNNINGAPFNVTTNDNSQMKTPVDRTMPDTGANRSGMQRFLATLHDANGAASCNKPGAYVDAVEANSPVWLPPATTSPDPTHPETAVETGLALGWDTKYFSHPSTFAQCEVFIIPDQAKFYIDAIIGKASLYARPDIVRQGLFGIGAITNDSLIQSSGLNALWPATTQVDGNVIHPKPEFFNRLTFFDFTNDVVNTQTRLYVGDLNGSLNGTSVCPTKHIDDPCLTQSDCADAADLSASGFDVPDCADGDWLQQRDPNTAFIAEDFNFIQALTPLVTAFANHEREDLFIALLDTLHRHWADDKGTASECKLSPTTSCTKDGLVTYEPLIAEAVTGDLIPALHDIEPILETLTIPHCTSIDSSTGLCDPTTAENYNGITVLANAARALLDPDLAASAMLTDRAGNVTAKRNDGTTNPQVTPIYLFTGALDGIDDAFATYAKNNPSDTTRQTLWLSARSQLTDQFLATTGTTTTTDFANAAVPQIVPTILDVTRAQLFANCPTSFAPPYDRCGWARDTLTQKVANVTGGPTFAGTMDLADAIRQNTAARVQLEGLLAYLVDPTSTNEAFPAVVDTTDDVLQLMRDDANLVPIYHVLAEAAQASLKDTNGNVVQESLVDSGSALLARISGKYIDTNGTEICSRELDPNQVLTIALQNLVTPSTNTGGETPFEVISDVIADINRVAPDQTTKLQAADYASITSEVSDFLINKQSGLEQFYEIVRLGTVR